jgi:hypothetical protein
METASFRHSKINHDDIGSLPVSYTARLMLSLKIVKTLCKKTPIEDWAVDYNNNHLEDSQFLKLIGWLNDFHPNVMIKKNLFVQVPQIPGDSLNLMISTKKLDDYRFLSDQTRNQIKKSHVARVLLFSSEFLDFNYYGPIEYALEKHHQIISQNEIYDSLIPEDKYTHRTQTCQVS